MLDEQVHELINLLINHEEKLRELYLAYGERFSDHREAWEEIAQDEQNHAKWIRALANKFEDKEFGLSERKLNPIGVKTSIEYLETEIARARDGNVSMLNAVSIGLQLENAIIEKGFFEIFDLDSGKFKKIRDALERETQEHKDRLAKWHDDLKS
jgi:rubrerythrin